MKKHIALCALGPLALGACGTTYSGDEYQAPRPAPGLTPEALESDPYVPTVQETEQWAEEEITDDNAEALLEDLESEILEDG